MFGEKLLGVPKLDSGTGANQAEATFELIQRLGLAENIVGMSFDTTSSNTGARNGAAVLLEAKLDKKLLYLACRHHILKLLAEASFLGTFWEIDRFFSINGRKRIFLETFHSLGPKIQMFEEFQKNWSTIDKGTFFPMTKANFAGSTLQTLRQEAVAVLEQSLSENFPRDDYREVVELSLLVLGANPQEARSKPPCPLDGPRHLFVENVSFSTTTSNQRRYWEKDCECHSFFQPDLCQKLDDMRKSRQRSTEWS
jgi:hypothetical protein